MFDEVEFVKLVFVYFSFSFLCVYVAFCLCASSIASNVWNVQTLNYTYGFELSSGISSLFILGTLIFFFFFLRVLCTVYVNVSALTLSIPNVSVQNLSISVVLFVVECRYDIRKYSKKNELIVFVQSRNRC